MYLNQLAGFFLLVSLTLAGMGAMLWAYTGAGSREILFERPVETDDPPPEFANGCEAFRQGRYRQALSAFETCVRQRDNFAEAYHNRGLALANLRQDDDAVANLLKAADLYAETDRPDALNDVRDGLSALKARKLARTS